MLFWFSDDDPDYGEMELESFIRSVVEESNGQSVRFQRIKSKQEI